VGSDEDAVDAEIPALGSGTDEPAPEVSAEEPTA
jgi:hypothetical protein